MKSKNKFDMIASVWNIIFLSITIGCFVFSRIVGGDAIDGYIENGKYFLGNHGSYRQVNKILYDISFIWDTLLFASFILYIPGLIFISKMQDKHERKKYEKR